MECKNAIIYKHFVWKSIKILGHYVEFVPHPKSLNGKFKPSHEELARLGFADIHTALADTVENLHISPTGETYSKKDVDKLLAAAKNEVRKEMVTMKDVITTEMKIFTEKVVEESSLSFRQEMRILREQLRVTMTAMDRIAGMDEDSMDQNLN